jgi:sugar phosphate isomerase/epimerase
MAHHDIFDAVELLASLGYQSVAITIDHGTLNPYDDRCEAQLESLAAALQRLDMHSAIETGARFLLDPAVKHEPTLLSADPAGRRKRIAFLKHAIDSAQALGSDCVSLWSGVLRDSIDEGEAFSRLLEGLAEVVEYAEEQQVTLGFEPEPGMLIDNMARYEQLTQSIHSERFRLTLDIGHLHCQGETPLVDQIINWSDQLVNVHIEDMCAGKHEHLMFGEGEIDFVPVLAALSQSGYDGGLHVELSRHSHEAPAAAAQAIELLGRAAQQSQDA